MRRPRSTLARNGRMSASPWGPPKEITRTASKGRRVLIAGHSMVGHQDGPRYTVGRARPGARRVHMPSSRVTRSFAGSFPIACAAFALVPSLFAAAQAPDAAAHKQWMNDASDAQEDFRFAVTDKDQKAATEALGKIEVLMTKTGEYWAAKKASDGVKLSRDAHDLAAQAGAAA